MKLNFLGKAAIAVGGAYAVTKLLEASEEAPQAVGCSGQELLKRLEDSFFGGAELICIQAAAHQDNWEMFIDEVNKSVIKKSSHQDRCNLWNYLRA